MVPGKQIEMICHHHPEKALRKLVASQSFINIKNSLLWELGAVVHSDTELDKLSR